MGKEIDSRIAEFAYVDRLVLSYTPNRLEGQTVTQRQLKTITETYIEETIDESGNIIQVEKTREVPSFDIVEIPAGSCNIYLNIRYELQDIDKNILEYKDKSHNLYDGDANKTVSQILELVNKNVYTFILEDKQDLTGFSINM